MSATARARTVAGGGAVTHEGIFLAEQLWPIKGQLVLALIGLAISGLMGLMQVLDRPHHVGPLSPLAGCRHHQ
jgi:hypothetical protein